jgi:hypothetical protein
VSLACWLLGHKMRAQAVEKVALFEDQEATRPYARATDVLLRCERCPRFTTKRIDGQWTLAQLVLGEEMRGSPAEAKVAD